MLACAVLAFVIVRQCGVVCRPIARVVSELAAAASRACTVLEMVQQPPRRQLALVFLDELAMSHLVSLLEGFLPGRVPARAALAVSVPC